MKLAYRIWSQGWEQDAQFERLVAFFIKHRAIVDEIALFSDYRHHGYTVPEVYARRMEVMSNRLARLRAEGFYNIGVDVQDTLGHFREGRDFVPPVPFPQMVGHDGTLSDSSPCPNGADYRRYITDCYRLLARTRPDFIWVDDDTRMENHGAAPYPCFCPVCLAHFATTSGNPLLERVDLVTALNAPGGGDLRRAWVEHNVLVLEDLCREIAQAIHEVDAGIDVGLMTIGQTINTYSGAAVGRWLTALGGTRARPGHGFYDDAVPRGMIAKALEVGRQCIDYPANVTDIQYEQESYPYQKLQKSTRIVLDECLLALAVGCSGIAVNALAPVPSHMEDYDDVMRGLADSKPLWDAYAEVSQGLPLVGLWPAAHPRLMANRQVRDGNWFKHDPAYNIELPNHLSEIGLALTTDPRAACVTVLSGRIAEAFDDDELRNMLAGGVLLDGEALQVLWERGLGELTGVHPTHSWDNGLRERLTDHPFNGTHAGDERDARFSLTPSVGWELEALDKSVGVLSRLVGYDDIERGPTVTCYQNILGGRVVVLGYAPWLRLGTGGKRTQMLAVVDWAAGGSLPITIEQTVRVSPWVRLSTDRQRVTVVLLNTSFDATGTLDLRLRAKCTELYMLTVHGRQSLAIEQGEGEVRCRVPSIAPWDTLVLMGN